MGRICGLPLGARTLSKIIGAFDTVFFLFILLLQETGVVQLNALSRDLWSFGYFYGCFAWMYACLWLISSLLGPVLLLGAHMVGQKLDFLGFPHYRHSGLIKGWIVGAITLLICFIIIKMCELAVMNLFVMVLAFSFRSFLICVVQAYRYELEAISCHFIQEMTPDM